MFQDGSEPLKSTSIFGVVFIVSKSLLGIERQRKLDPKASEPCYTIDISNVRLLPQCFNLYPFIWHLATTFTISF